MVHALVWGLQHHKSMSLPPPCCFQPPSLWIHCLWYTLQKTGDQNQSLHTMHHCVQSLYTSLKNESCHTSICKVCFHPNQNQTLGTLWTQQPSMQARQNMTIYETHLIQDSKPIHILATQHLDFIHNHANIFRIQKQIEPKCQQSSNATIT